MTAAGWWSDTAPGPNGVEYAFDAAVWMPAKRARGATCFAFDVERAEATTTVTAYCDPPEGRGRLMASFEIWSTVREGDTGVVVDRCRDRHDMRRDTVFTCTVRNPDAAP